MKKSELTMTGETYRLTPGRWGATSIMVDEDAVCEVMTECFGEPCDPDDDDDDRPDTVQIATDTDGIFYAVLDPYRSRNGVWHNLDMYRHCQNPAESSDGAAELYGRVWEVFDKE